MSSYPLPQAAENEQGMQEADLSIAGVDTDELEDVNATSTGTQFLQDYISIEDGGAARIQHLFSTFQNSGLIYEKTLNTYFPEFVARGVDRLMICRFLRRLEASDAPHSQPQQQAAPPRQWSGVNRKSVGGRFLTQYSTRGPDSHDRAEALLSTFRRTSVATEETLKIHYPEFITQRGVNSRMILRCLEKLRKSPRKRNPSLEQNMFAPDTPIPDFTSLSAMNPSYAPGYQLQDSFSLQIQHPQHPTQHPSQIPGPSNDTDSGGLAVPFHEEGVDCYCPRCHPLLYTDAAFALAAWAQKPS